MHISTILTALSISNALVTKLLVIEQLLHPALKFIVSVPWHNFHFCPSSQQILATPLIARPSVQCKGCACFTLQSMFKCGGVRDNLTNINGYCNSLLYGISDGLLQRLQSVQNATARLVTGARLSDHITPVLRQLHWLPVRQRVAFKIAGLLHQSLAGAAPAYLADDAGRRTLRFHSNDTRKLLVPRTHNKLGDRSFSAAGPRLCNDLPPGLRWPGLSFDSFRRSLKTHLFGDWSA